MGIQSASSPSAGKTAYATFDGQSTPVHLKTLTPVYSRTSSSVYHESQNGYPSPGYAPDMKYEYDQDSFYGGRGQHGGV